VPVAARRARLQGAVAARVCAAGHRRPPRQARLTLAELDEAIGAFIREVYNVSPHSETGAPQQRWEDGAFIPRMPDSLEQLDLLLLTVTKPRKIHPDGIHFQGLRYLDPVLADGLGAVAAAHPGYRPGFRGHGGPGTSSPASQQQVKVYLTRITRFEDARCGDSRRTVGDESTGGGNGGGFPV
jgi:hypothetical protein